MYVRARCPTPAETQSIVSWGPQRCGVAEMCLGIGLWISQVASFEALQPSASQILVSRH